MTIVRKLYVAVGATAASLAALGLYSHVTTGQMKAALQEIRQYPELQSLLNDRTIDHYKWAEALSVGTLLLGKDFAGQLDPTKCNFGKWYYATKPPKELEETFKKAEEPHRRLHATAGNVLAALKSGQPDVARSVYQQQTAPALVETQQVLGEMRVGVQSILNRVIASAQARQDAMRRWALVVYAVLLVGLTAGAAVFCVRPLRRKLNDVTCMLDAIAGGDLTRQIEAHDDDEIGVMASRLNHCTEAMREALADVQTTAATVSAASRELSGAAQQISAGAQQQASSLEETAASLEEITGTVKQSADNAAHANRLASVSRDAAANGGAIAGEAVAGMSEINRSSHRIAAIITTIDEIAFQTNLLALNAAVEAARAGEQGRGFAVVAAEVRNLAQRAATAAKEIKGLIEDSVAKVESGSVLVNKSGATLSDIVGSVKQVTELVAEIATASGQQASGIDQLNRAVMQMDEVTQSNAVQTDRLTTTAEALAENAAHLERLVARFTLGSRATAPAVGPSSPPSAGPPDPHGAARAMRRAAAAELEVPAAR